MFRRTFLSLSLTLLAACGGTPAASTDDAAPPQPSSHPLAAFSGQPLLVMPVRYFSASDSLGWASRIGEPQPFLRELDRALGAALQRRDLGSNWILGDRIIDIARRNRTMVSDPLLLPAERHRTGRIVPGSMVRDPLASQLRSLGALANARYVLLPIEMRIENAPGGGARPVLRVLLVDTRTAMIRFGGEIEGEAAATPSPALMATLAERFADLFAAP